MEFTIDKNNKIDFKEVIEMKIIYEQKIRKAIDMLYQYGEVLPAEFQKEMLQIFTEE